MVTEENDSEKQPFSPTPEKTPQTSKEDRVNLGINKSRDSDWSNKQPLHEGYRPTENTINPTPPSDSGSTDSE